MPKEPKRYTQEGLPILTSSVIESMMADLSKINKTPGNLLLKEVERENPIFYQLIIELANVYATRGSEELNITNDQLRKEVRDYYVEKFPLKLHTLVWSRLLEHPKNKRHSNLAL